MDSRANEAVRQVVLKSVWFKKWKAFILNHLNVIRTYPLLKAEKWFVYLLISETRCLISRVWHSLISWAFLSHTVKFIPASGKQLIITWCVPWVFLQITGLWNVTVSICPQKNRPIVSLLLFILSYNKHCQNSREVTLCGADVPTIVYLRFGDVESPAQKCAKADYDKLALTK